MTAMERSIADNTALTERIARNTEGLVGFSDDLASGSRFLCRFVKGMQFILRDVIDPYWKPTLVVSGILYWLTHDHVLPLWLMQFSKVLLG